MRILDVSKTPTRAVTVVVSIGAVFSIIFIYFCPFFLLFVVVVVGDDVVFCLIHCHVLFNF